MRQRRQSVPNARQNLPYPGWQGGSQNPSGGSPGAYYGTSTKIKINRLMFFFLSNLF